MGLMCPACGGGWERGHFCVEMVTKFYGGGDAMLDQLPHRSSLPQPCILRSPYGYKKLPTAQGFIWRIQNGHRGSAVREVPGDQYDVRFEGVTDLVTVPANWLEWDE